MYEHAINPDTLRAKIADGQRRFTATNRRLVVDKREHLITPVLSPWTWHDDAHVDQSWTPWSPALEEVLITAGRSACSARQFVASIVGSNKKLKTAVNSTSRWRAKRRTSHRFSSSHL